jgi:hypothetical protein
MEIKTMAGRKGKGLFSEGQGNRGKTLRYFQQNAPA